MAIAKMYTTTHTIQMQTAEETVLIMGPDGKPFVSLLLYFNAEANASVDVNWDQRRFKGEAFALKAGRDIIRKEIDNTGQLITVLNARKEALPAELERYLQQQKV